MAVSKFKQAEEKSVKPETQSQPDTQPQQGAEPQQGRQSENENGSTIPLILGIFIMSLSIFIISANVFMFRAAKMDLEILGEDFLSSLYQEIDYEEYFFGDDVAVSTGARSWLPFQCAILMKNIVENSRLLVDQARIKSARCNYGRVSLVLSKEVKMLFQPAFLASFKPEVTATISGGVQRTRS